MTSCDHAPTFAPLRASSTGAALLADGVGAPKSREISDRSRRNQIRSGIVIAGTLDTKSEAIDFARNELARRGHNVIIIDCGVLGTPLIEAAITREEIARAGGGDLGVMRRERNRELAIPIMIRGLEVELAHLLERGCVQGFLGIGGGTNTAIAAAAFRALPFGVPKMLVSTLACGNTRPFVGIKDVILLHSVVDVLGLNDFLRATLRQAANALSAMIEEAATSELPDDTSGCVAITSFGCTTEAATHALNIFGARKMDVLAFHARGIGGEAMETFVREGRVRAVLDLTTTEIADEIAGGICSGGPDRLSAAGERGIPQVVLPGAIDVVNFGPPSSVPDKFAGRTFLVHTPNATLMRTTAEENARIGIFVADKLNAARGPAGAVVPIQGFSSYDAVGQPFFDPVADAAFRDALLQRLHPHIPVRIVDAHINDRACIDVATSMLVEMMGEASGRSKRQ